MRFIEPLRSCASEAGLYRLKQYIYRSVNSVLVAMGREMTRRIDSPAYSFQRVQGSCGVGEQLVLVTGPFSYPDWSATFGDTEAMKVIAGWLEDAGIAFDIACHPSNGFAGLDIATLDPLPYTVFMYVCGPWDDQRKNLLLPRFAHCTKVGINLSVLNPDSHGFDSVFARDNGSLSNPDIVFSRRTQKRKSLAGLALVHAQPEYGGAQRHRRVAEVVERYLSCEKEVTALPIDTLHVGNGTSTRNAMQLDHLMRRLDVVITSRLHGLVFALMAGTPVVAIDPVDGGGKVTAQARSVNWPLVFNANDLDVPMLRHAVRQCIDGAMDEYVNRSRQIAFQRVNDSRRGFLDFMGNIRLKTTDMEEMAAPRIAGRESGLRRSSRL